MSPKTRRKRLWKTFSPFVSPFHLRKQKPQSQYAASRPNGEITILSIQQASCDSESGQAVASDSSGNPYPYHYVTFLAKIKLKEGSNLAIRDASGSSDPYVRFKYRDRVVYKSNIIYKNLNPIWDEEFSMLVDDITSPIELEVYDYDRFCTDDFMGSAVIDLSQLKLFQSGSYGKIGPIDLSIKLSPHGAPPGTCSEDEDLGSISLSLSVLPQTKEDKDKVAHLKSLCKCSSCKKQKVVFYPMPDSSSKDHNYGNGL